MASKSCQVCSQKTSKYKCPKCQILYCSVPCYKSHVCEPSIPESEMTSQVNQGTEERKESKEPVDIVEEDQLQSSHIAALLSSSEIQKSLSSPSLARVLEQIDRAPSQEDALKRLKEAQEGHPEFLAFSNQVLDILDASRDQPST